MRRQLAPLIVAASTLTACATGPVTMPAPSNPGSPVALPGAPPAPPPAGGEGAALPDPPNPIAGATAALLTQSRDQREAGDLGGAAATVERALSIAPDEALFWVELAEIRMAQGDAVLAGEMARKALTLTGADSALAARARRLISR